MRLTITSLFSGGSFSSGAIPPSEYPVTVSLSSPMDPEVIHKIEIFDADGHSVPCTINKPPVQPEGRPRSYRYAFSCILSRDVEKATVKVTYFDRVDNARLPFHVVTGIGLGKE